MPRPIVQPESLDQLKSLPGSRQDAQIENSMYYFTGVPCKRNHQDKRYTKNGCCRMCTNIKQRKSAKKYKNKRNQYKELNKDHLRIKAKQRRRSHPEIHQNADAKYRSKKPAAVKKARDNYRKNHPDRVLADINNRRAQKANAIPLWADRIAIERLYEEARSLTLSTKKDYQVDHIVPLIHPLVCGLHCEDNLQVITAEKNQKKNNTFTI